MLVNFIEMFYQNCFITKYAKKKKEKSLGITESHNFYGDIEQLTFLKILLKNVNVRTQGIPGLTGVRLTRREK